ncbi:hypothetical protein KPL78_19460 [Roseomonas sp. HJA6]|uniref:Uncharacterized protein n=1 Tax=Roseomonas alba TaxID=2846776 RepID=A0ABS7ACL6_9PROT|nr:hypothetical protein [Neoroseomonas alba]MBW6400047.1 hypothetical protein [Neoroseomonas alba]
MRKVVLAAATFGAVALAAFALAAWSTVTGSRVRAATRNRTVTRMTSGQWSAQGTAIGPRGW